LRALGILGGTFNPPHLGHLAVARNARDELALERVMLMPVHTPPHKAPDVDPGPQRRLRMCRLLTDGEQGIQVCGLEVERGGPSYTADTLIALHDMYPEAELTFIVGADTARALPSWHEPALVLSLTRLAVAARGSAERDEVRAAVASVSPQARPLFLDMAPIEISSSLARERAGRGEPLEELLGDSVAAYVSDHGLYGEAGAGEGLW
jgi:nicotinate-nucleotide adenylyltransferase